MRYCMLRWCLLPRSWLPVSSAYQHAMQWSPYATSKSHPRCLMMCKGSSYAHHDDGARRV